MAARSDMLQEVVSNLNSSGVYESEWYESANLKSVLVAVSTSGSPSITIQHSVYTFDVVASETVTDSFTPALLPSRYFRVVISNGTANSSFRLSVREWE